MDTSLHTYAPPKKQFILPDGVKMSSADLKKKAEEFAAILWTQLAEAMMNTAAPEDEDHASDMYRGLLPSYLGEELARKDNLGMDKQLSAMLTVQERSTENDVRSAQSSAFFKGQSKTITAAAA